MEFKAFGNIKKMLTGIEMNKTKMSDEHTIHLLACLTNRRSH